MLQLIDLIPHIFVCVSESEQLQGFFNLPSDITALQNIVQVQIWFIQTFPVTNMTSSDIDGIPITITVFHQVMELYQWDRTILYHLYKIVIACLKPLISSTWNNILPKESIS